MKYFIITGRVNEHGYKVDEAHKNVYIFVEDLIDHIATNTDSFVSDPEGNDCKILQYGGDRDLILRNLGTYFSIPSGFSIFYKHVDDSVLDEFRFTRPTSDKYVITVISRLQDGTIIGQKERGYIRMVEGEKASDPRKFIHELYDIDFDNIPGQVKEHKQNTYNSMIEAVRSIVPQYCKVTPAIIVNRY